MPLFPYDDLDLGFTQWILDFQSLDFTISILISGFLFLSLCSELAFFFFVFSTGPTNDRTTGSRKNPLAIAKTMIPYHILKKTSNMYDFDCESTVIAKKVEKPP